VYVGSDDANLYALGAKDGKFRLHFKAGLEAFSAGGRRQHCLFQQFRRLSLCD